MKVTVLQENLLPKLAAVARVASGKSALPVLENILLSAEKGVLKLFASDLETGITTSVGAKVERAGETTIPARVLLSLVSNLPPGKLELSVEKDILTLASEGFSSQLNGLPATEFPTFPKEGKKVVTLPAKELRTAINQVSFASSQDESRPILTGILLKLAGGTLVLTGVDGFRLAERKIKTGEGELSVVVPSRSLAEVARLVEGEEVAVEQAQEGQLIFRTPDFFLFTSTLEGEFPDYEQIIPANSETTLTIEREELQQALQLTSVFAEAGTVVVTLDYDPKKKSVEVASTEAQVGGAKKEVAATVEGKSGKAAFNSHYLADALNAFSGAEVALSLNSALDPVLFTDPKDKHYLQVVMPVRLQE